MEAGRDPHEDAPAYFRPVADADQRSAVSPFTAAREIGTARQPPLTGRRCGARRTAAQYWCIAVPRHRTTLVEFPSIREVVHDSTYCPVVSCALTPQRHVPCPDRSQATTVRVLNGPAAPGASVVRRRPSEGVPPIRGEPDIGVPRNDYPTATGGRGKRRAGSRGGGRPRGRVSRSRRRRGPFTSSRGEGRAVHRRDATAAVPIRVADNRSSVIAEASRY
jgi:hypothetical protein